MTTRVKAPDITVTPKVMDRIKEKGGARGWVPVIDRDPNGKMTLRLTPWWNDPQQRERGTGKVRWHPNAQPGQTFPAPPSVTQAIQSRINPDRKTTARQKAEEFTLRMLSEGRRFTKNGVLVWPASIERKLIAAGCTPANNLVKEVETLTRLFVVESANRQKVHDRKKTVVDGTAHYAA